MRIITALKLLIRNYYRIIPTYLCATFMIFIVGQMFPIIGAILVLPITIGVAYVMVFEVSNIRKRTFFPLFIGFKKGKYGRNVWYLFLRQIIQYLPLVIGIVLDQLFAETMSGIKIDLYFMTIGRAFIISTIPSAIFSLLFSMVPYLLADPLYDSKKGSPLKISAFILRGNYLRLISIRLIFLPFIAWLSSGLILSLISFYNNIFGGSFDYPNITSSWLFSAPVILLLFTPWYQMTHAVLYGQIRGKLRVLMTKHD